MAAALLSFSTSNLASGQTTSEHAWSQHLARSVRLLRRAGQVEFIGEMTRRPLPWRHFTQ